MFIKYFVLFFVFNLIPAAQFFELVYDDTPGSGWTRTVSTEYEMDYIFTCPHEFEKQHNSLSFQMGNFPYESIKSLTIQDCDLELIIIPHVLNGVLEALTIRNVSQLTIEHKNMYPLVKYKYDVSVLILENIRMIKRIGTDCISGTFKEVRIKRCHIENLDWSSIVILETRLFEFTDNVVVNASSLSFTFELFDDITFSGNEFRFLGNNFIYFRKTNNKNINFQFTSNKIYESKVEFMNSMLNVLSENYSILVQQNEFECLKSDWLKQKDAINNRPSNREAADNNLEPTIHQVFMRELLTENSKNVCFDSKWKGIVIKRFKMTYQLLKHFYGEEISQNSTSSQNNPNNLGYTSILVTETSSASKNFDTFSFQFLFGTILSFTYLV